MRLAADDRVATRPDGDATIQAGFFGPEDARLFGCLHIPARSPTAGVLICSPLHADFVKIYRNEVQLAQRLCSSGFAVLRFHYRGQGHSDGEPDDITFPSLVGDALIAIENLRSRTNVSRIGLVGCRVGALVAAGVGFRLEGAPLVLWEPVLRPDAYLREANRSRMISNLSGAVSAGVSSDVRISDLNERGSLDVHGYPIYRELVQSLQGRSLVEELGDAPRAVRVIQISKSRVVRKDLAAVINRWERLGIVADVRCVVGEIAWWFRGASAVREQSEAVAEEIARETSGWMTAQFDEGDR